MESLLATTSSRRASHGCVSIAQLAAFPEICELGYFARLVEELDAGSDGGDWPGPDALRDLDPQEANAMVTARLRGRISAIMGYADRLGSRSSQPLTELGLDSLWRCGSGTRRAVTSASSHRWHSCCRARHCRTSRLISSASSASQGTTPPRTGTAFAIEPSSVPQRANAPQRGERQDNEHDQSLHQIRYRPTRLRSSAWPGRFPGAIPVGVLAQSAARRGIDSHLVGGRPDRRRRRRKGLGESSYIRRAALLDG